MLFASKNRTVPSSLAFISLILLIIAICDQCTGSIGTPNNGIEMQHRTKAATEKQNDLWCYRCDTMLDGERCMDLAGNSSNLFTKCAKDQRKCQVRRISMSTSTDEITGLPKMWLLQRNCSEICEPGCIVIGERTKLHSCITCCDEVNFCNAGTGGKVKIHANWLLPKVSSTIQMYLYFVWKYG